MPGIVMDDTPYNACYEKLRWKVWQQNFNILKVGNWLRQRWNPHIIGKCQYLSLSIWRAEEIYQILDTDPRLVECHPKLPLRTKIFFVLGVIRDERDLPQGSAYGDNDVTSSGDRAGKRARFFFSHKLRDIIGYTQSREICAINNRKARGDKTLDFQIRPERTRGNILYVVADSALC